MIQYRGNNEWCGDMFAFNGFLKKFMLDSLNDNVANETNSVPETNAQTVESISNTQKEVISSNSNNREALISEMQNECSKMLEQLRTIKQSVGDKRDRIIELKYKGKLYSKSIDFYNKSIFEYNLLVEKINRIYKKIKSEERIDRLKSFNESDETFVLEYEAYKVKKTREQFEQKSKVLVEEKRSAGVEINSVESDLLKGYTEMSQELVNPIYSKGLSTVAFLKTPKEQKQSAPVKVKKHRAKRNKVVEIKEKENRLKEIEDKLKLIEKKILKNKISLLEEQKERYENLLETRRIEKSYAKKEKEKNDTEELIKKEQVTLNLIEDRLSKIKKYESNKL